MHITILRSNDSLHFALTLLSLALQATHCFMASLMTKRLVVPANVT